MALEPFALELYRRFLSGETVQQLSRELAIPAERISRRIEVAAAFRERQKPVTYRRLAGTPLVSRNIGPTGEPPLR